MVPAIFSMLAPSSLTFLPLPEKTHSRLTTIPFGTVVSMPQPISEGAGVNNAGYFPPNAAVAALPYFMFLISQKFSSDFPCTTHVAVLALQYKILYILELFSTRADI